MFEFEVWGESLGFLEGVGLWILGRRGDVSFGKMGEEVRRRGDVGVCIGCVGLGLGEGVWGLV